MARREYQDPSILVRQSVGGPEYYIRYRVKVLDAVDGKPAIRRVERWRALGLCARMTKRQAEREKDRILREVNSEVYTVQSQVRFSVLLAQFVEHHMHTLSGPSQATYRQHIHAYIEPAFRDLRLCDIGTLQIEQLFRTMETSGLSRATRSTTRGVLRAIAACSERWGYGELAVRGASLGGGPRHVRQCRLPSLEDVRRLRDAAEGDVPLLIETLCATGLRISEAAGLTVADLDFGSGRAWIRHRRCRGDVGQTKSESGVRAVGLGDTADALSAHVARKAPEDPVFTWRGEPICDNTLLANYLSPLMVRLGIKFPGFGWHTFRRLHLSMMSLRLSVFDLRRQAGHASVATTQRYIADDVERRAEAARGLFVVRSA